MTNKKDEVWILLSKYNQFPKHELKLMGLIPIYEKCHNKQIKKMK